MPEVKLWGEMRPCAGGAQSVTVDAGTIREMFTQLQTQYPDMATFIKRGVAVSIDGVIYRDNWNTALPADAEIYLLPRIEGG